jgi:hypothetical protein
MESLEDRSMMTGGSLTPAQAIAAMNAQSAIVATQTAQQQNNILAIENGLLTVAHQLDADNFAQIQTNTTLGNSQAALADMTERASIVQAEQRITTEFTTIVQSLLTANAAFKTESALLVSEVTKGTIAPAAAVAAQVSDYEIYKSAALGVQVQTTSEDQLELVNLSGLTYGVEGVAGQQNLGNFYGKFDVQGSGHTPGVLTDYQGAVTTRFTVSAHLLQGTFTAATTDYLQAFAGPTGSQMVKQPITGGTITATVSAAPDGNGFTIHGTVFMTLGPIGNLPSSSATYQMEANLTGQNTLIGNLLVGGQVVGSFNWTRQ